MEATAVRPGTLPRPISKQQPSNLSLPSPTSATRSGHTCGSLFAKCNCTVTNTIPASAKTVEQHQHTERRKTLFQSYSHPDTNFVFTDENRNPSLRTKTPREQSTAPRTKRMSTPCIPGTYSVLDVAVHPEVVLTMSHSNGRIEPMYAETGVVKRPKPILKKSITFQGQVSSLLARLAVEERCSSLKNLSSSTSSQEDDVSSESGSGNSQLARDFTDLERKRSLGNAGTDRTESDANRAFLQLNAIGYQQQGYGTSRPIDIDRVNQQYRERRDSVRSTGSAFSANAPTSFSRKASRSLGDNSSRADQLRQYVMMRKQSDCNEAEYSRAQNQRTIDLEAETQRLRQTITDRDNEINKLKREIHKLKSVLQQTTKPPAADGDLLSSLQSHHRMPGQQTVSSAGLQPQTLHSANMHACALSHSAPNNTESQTFASNSCPHLTIAPSSMPKQLQHTMSLPAAVKKQGVSGESTDTTGQMSRDILIPKYDKDFRSKQLIKDAIMENDFLKNIDSSQVRELVESMYSLEVKRDAYVIREGEAGAHLFVSAAGEFEVIKEGNVLGRMGKGKAFGELAILYNCTRTASIRVLSDSRLWVLDRRVFQAIMMRTGMQRIEENISFLRSVPLLQNLSNNLLAKIADVLEVEFYPAGAYVIRQGASGDTFFLISQGTVKVTQRIPGSTANDEEEIRTLTRGDYFGEQALLKEDKRTANIIAIEPGVECLTLDRESFCQLIGDLCELNEKDYGDESRVLAMKRSESKAQIFGSDSKQELLDIDMESLEIIATLGIGGFGRVELVKCDTGTGVRSFALKCLKKQHIVDTRQEEHVFSERTIMLSCKSPFICRLYRTYRDTKYVYMLLEACMGGEVWTILRDRGYFDDTTTQFIIGCVLQAFEYLHRMGIVYRDLKPENLMLDDRGYVKLVDFGFSKYIGYSGKTWTFCGTPEYVAPEIILNKGHDRAVDYWALGILIHELLTGTPPFNGSDPMKTYNIILKGIDMVDFPKHMSRSGIQLIKRLCRDIPAERLGYQRGGTQDIKKHKWFQNFDWDGLANLTMPPPLLQPVAGPLDTSNFDDFPMDCEEPNDEMSGWDEGF